MRSQPAPHDSASRSGRARVADCRSSGRRSPARVLPDRLLTGGRRPEPLTTSHAGSAGTSSPARASSSPGTSSPAGTSSPGSSSAGSSSAGSSSASVLSVGGPVPAPRDGDRSAIPADSHQPPWLAERRDGVLTMKEAVAAGFSRTEIRRRVDGGLWQLHAGDVLVTQPGPLTLIQRLWCALVSIGPDALLGGASAAALGGLRGYGEPWLTVILASGRRVTPRPGVKIRATARLGPEDLHEDGWPPRTTLPRSLVDLAEWAVSHDEARTVLALAIASGIVESDEIRAALARRGPIARRQVIGDVLDDLDGDAPWVPDLLFRRLEVRHGLPPALRGRPDPRAPGRLDLYYEDFQVRVEVGAVSAPGIRTATEAAAPGSGPVSAISPREGAGRGHAGFGSAGFGGAGLGPAGAGPGGAGTGLGGPGSGNVGVGLGGPGSGGPGSGGVGSVGVGSGGPWLSGAGAVGPWPAAGRAPGIVRRADRLVLRIPRRLLMEEPDRVGTAVATTLRQRGWPGAPRVPRHAAAAASASPLGTAFDPALAQVLGPAVGIALGGTHAATSMGTGQIASTGLAGIELDVD